MSKELRDLTEQEYGYLKKAAEISYSERSTITFYRDKLKTALKFLNDEQLGKYFRALISYADTGETVESDDQIFQIAYEAGKDAVDHDKRTYIKNYINGNKKKLIEGHDQGNNAKDMPTVCQHNANTMPKARQSNANGIAQNTGTGTGTETENGTRIPAPATTTVTVKKDDPEISEYENSGENVINAAFFAKFDMNIPGLTQELTALEHNHGKGRVLYAIKKAALNNSRTLEYVKGVLNNLEQSQ